MSTTVIGQWLTLTAFVALGALLVAVAWKQRRLRPVAMAWLAVVLNHVALYAIAFIWFEQYVGFEATQIWSQATRIHVAFTVAWMALAMARGRL